MKKKHKIINLHLFETDALAEYFEAMASKGYMLTGLYLGRMHFQACTPQKVHFHLNIYNKGSYFNPKLVSDEEIGYCDFISDYGYELVCTYSNYQVFKSVDENIIPIETVVHEEITKERYRTIIKYEMANHGFLAIMFTLIGILQVSTFFRIDDLYTLTSNIALFTPLLWGLIMIMSWMRIYPFIKWLIQKDKYHITYSRLLARERNINILWILIVFVFISTILSSNFSFQRIIIPLLIFFLVVYLAYIVLEKILSRFTKKYASIIALLASIYMGFIFNINFLINPFTSNPVGIVEAQDESIIPYDIFVSDLPKATDTYTREDGSFILKQLVHSETYAIPSAINGYESNNKRYSYNLYTIMFPTLQDYLTKVILFEYGTPQLQASGEGWKWYQAESTIYIIKDHHILQITEFPNRELINEENIPLFIEKFQL